MSTKNLNLIAAAFAVSLVTLAGTAAYADDSAPAAKLPGPLASGSYNPHGRTWLQPSTLTRDQVNGELAAAQAKPKLAGPLASGSYNPFGSAAQQSSAVTRGQVTAELAAARAKPKLAGPLASGSYNPFGSEMTAPADKPVYAGARTPGQGG
jgi:hypothetical protein